MVQIPRVLSANQPHLRPKGAKIATFCENKVRTCDPHRDVGTGTISRLDDIGIGIGAGLASGRVNAPDRRVVS